MDTHITTAPDIDERIGAPLGSPIRLPGGRGTLPHLEDSDLEPAAGLDGEQAVAETGTSQRREKLAAATPSPARRMGLLSTAAAVVVLAGIGSAAWAEREGALNLPLPLKMVSLLRTGLPSANRVSGEVGVAAMHPQGVAPVAIRPDPDQSARAARQQAEFASLKSGDAVAEVGVAGSNRPATAAATVLPVMPAQPDPIPVAAAQPPAPVVSVALTDTGTPVGPTPSTPIPAVASPAAPTIANIPSAVPAPVVPPAAPVAAAVVITQPAPKPRDPVQTAIDVRAEPLSPKQQVEVVGLVRELGAQLKESRLTVAQMQATVADLKEQLDSRMTEFDGRLGLAEAGTVLAQSARAALPQSVMSTPATSARPGVAGSRQGPAAMAVSAAAVPNSRSVKDFRVQGASPGLAVLNVIGAAPGEVPVLYVALGDQVPGIGRIKSIYQRGTTWLVQTDAGLIQ